MAQVTSASRAQGLFRLTDEQEMLRDAVRVLADDRVAPRAAEIDRTAEFPEDMCREMDVSEAWDKHKSTTTSPKES